MRLWRVSCFLDGVERHHFITMQKASLFRQDWWRDNRVVGRHLHVDIEPLEIPSTREGVAAALDDLAQMYPPLNKRRKSNVV